MPRLRLSAPVLAAAALLGAAAPASAAHQVHLRGTAYEFNNVRVKLAGATIRVAELPRLRATVRANGTYDLRVPDGQRVTPYIVADGHHTIYLQTFTTAGEDLANVNFQTPSDSIYRALAGLLAVPLGPDGELAQCAIVSTFSTRNVRAVPFDQFTAYGAHGVAGATAKAASALPGPTYFNDQVIPDPAQRLSSKDGGVIWTRVPAGRYTITARSPSTRFASFVATCAPGRVVNANPPWGLHELGLRNPAAVSAGWSVRAGLPVLTSLRARGLPAKASVRVRCTGARCPFSSKTLAPRGAAADLRAALPRQGAGLGAGQTLEVAVSARPHDGKVLRWPIRLGRTPQAATLCVPLGGTLPRPRC
jgi:hypothetical protein